MTIDIDAIRKREQAATRGAWTTGADKEWSDALAPWALVIDATYPLIELQEGPQGAADAEFIAHARQDIPALLDEIDRLRADIAEYAADNRRLVAELIGANQRAAQVADLADKLHKAETQVHSLEKATTAYANENQRLRDRRFADKPVIDAALAWAETVEDDTPGDFLKATDNLHDAVEQYRVMDAALDTAHGNENAVQQRPDEPDEGGSPLDPTCPDCETPQYGAHICPGHPAGVA